MNSNTSLTSQPQSRKRLAKIRPECCKYAAATSSKNHFSSNGHTVIQFSLITQFQVTSGSFDQRLGTIDRQRRESFDSRKTSITCIILQYTTQEPCLWQRQSTFSCERTWTSTNGKSTSDSTAGPKSKDRNSKVYFLKSKISSLPSKSVGLTFDTDFGEICIQWLNRSSCRKNRPWWEVSFIVIKRWGKTMRSVQGLHKNWQSTSSATNHQQKLESHFSQWVIENHSKQA